MTPEELDVLLMEFVLTFGAEPLVDGSGPWPRGTSDWLVHTFDRYYGHERLHIDQREFNPWMFYISLRERFYATRRT